MVAKHTYFCQGIANTPCNGHIIKILNFFCLWNASVQKCSVCISHARAAAAATLFLCNIPDILHALSRHMPLQKSVHCLSQKQGRLFMTYSRVLKLTLSRFNWQHEVQACFIQRTIKILSKILNGCPNFIMYDYLWRLLIFLHRQNKVDITVLVFNIDNYMNPPIPQSNM